MKRLKVTVIIPAYNSEEYIGRCLESVLRQSYQDFEVLVINDGSRDNTDAVVKEFAKKDRRVRYVEQKNMGVARTRNKAIKLAKGEFITFVDNDDYIDEDYLESLLPTGMEDVVTSGFKRPDKNGKIVTQMKLIDTEWSKFMNPMPWAKIYRRSFVVENGLEFLDNNIGEDIYFNLVAMLTAKKVKILDYVGYNWFYNTGSISNTKHKDFEKVDIFRLLNSCYDELKRRGLLEKNYQLVEFFFYRFIMWFLLYACKGQKKTKIDKVYTKLFEWLEERFPEYRKNRMMKGNLPGEVRATRVACRVFAWFHGMGLGKILIGVWAKI